MSHRGEWGPDPRMIPYADETAPVRNRRAATEEPGDDLVVRPFMLTGGRTRPLHDGLRIETLLSAAPAALSAPLRFERRAIVELCQAPMSMADLAVALKVPLGVVRVIVADLVTDGYLRIEEQLGELPIELIERIRDRVRAL
jgi:hypothetical protein